MNPEISIRIAMADDLPLIEDLAKRIWPQTYKEILTSQQMDYMMEQIYSSASLQRQFHQQQHTFLVVEFNNQPVGFAAYSLVQDNGIYKLHKIYIDPTIQGKGIGKATIRFITDSLQARQATALQLNVNRYNKARFFYEKLGFVIIREEDIDIGNGYYMNDYVMELPVIPNPPEGFYVK
jgi:diamine N-acetyltransferase